MQEGAEIMEQEQEIFQGEDFYRFADAALEIIIRFDRLGRIQSGQRGSWLRRGTD